ncbi:MAG: hypothetical protein ACOYON_11470 [Fimbriimonas sp.]
MKRVLFFLLAMVFLISGCGGSGSSTPDGTARLRMSIQWAARERSFNAPTSAVVAVLRVQSADGNLFASQRIYRRADIAAYTEQIETRMSLAPGNYQVAVWFYPTVDSDFFC